MEDKIEACYQAIMNVDIPQVRRRRSKDVEGQSPVFANRADRVALHFGGRPSKVRANDYSDKTLRACALWRECEVGKQCL